MGAAATTLQVPPLEQLADEGLLARAVALYELLDATPTDDEYQRAINDAELMEMIQAADVDGDGRLNFEEFAEVMYK